MNNLRKIFSLLRENQYFRWWMIAYVSLPPGGRGTACGGRSLRYKRQSKIKFIITPAPSPDFVGSSLPEGAYLKHRIYYSGEVFLWRSFSAGASPRPTPIGVCFI